MATKIYESGQVELLNGVIVEAVPLKIKYLRELMDAFELVKNSDGDDEAMTNLALCASITLKQYCPEFYPEAEDLCNMPIVYQLLNYAAGIKVNKDSDESVKKQAVDSGSSWEELINGVSSLKEFSDVSMNFAMTPSGSTLSNNSIFDSPILKKAVLTFSLSTSSVL